MGKKYGYLRVSTSEQNTDRQFDALVKADIKPDMMYIDKQSGKDFKRTQYIRLIKKLNEGDTLFVKSIDRLGRNYDEIQDQWRLLTKEKGIDVVVLDIPLLDTRVRNENLTGKFIADLVLQILSYVAQTERENIRQRQAEGIRSAKERGVHFGRPKIPVPEDFIEVATKWRHGEIRQEEALSILGIGKTYFYKNVKRLSI